MKSIRGDAKMCCSTSGEFRDRVMILAHQRGMSLQEFVLAAVRDAVQGNHTHTLEGRRAVALQALFNSKRTPANVREAAEALLRPYMPEARQAPPK